MSSKTSLKLSSTEAAALFTDDHWASLFPPVLDVKQAAQLAKVPVRTIYDWSSRRRLDDCASRQGKRLLILRDRFVQYLFN
jgi:hypothetical protein